MLCDERNHDLRNDLCPTRKRDAHSGLCSDSKALLQMRHIGYVPQASATSIVHEENTVALAQVNDINMQSN